MNRLILWGYGVRVNQLTGSHMLEPLIDSSQRHEPTEGSSVRQLGEVVGRRLWFAQESMTRPLADLCLVGGALGSTARISAPDKRVRGRVVDSFGRS